MDLEDQLTREGVYAATNPDGVDEYMDFPVPFLPETQFYRVIKIEEGMYNYVSAQQHAS